ncbi:GH3 auxin-responsive promoter family protein, partial [Chloroflexota bacterium]
MSITRELLRQGRHGELWQICCGFLDLTLDQFMSIQKQLLLEQIELLKRCKLGRKVMRGALPETIEEFRAQVPLTSYADYCPELFEQREEVLPVKPARWVQTSGRSGEYPCKWIPVTKRFWEEAGLNFSAVAIFGTCHHKGEIVFKEGFKLLHAMAHQPYLTGNVAAKLQDDLGFKFLPGISESTNTPFEERVDKGFNMALSNGMDGFFGLAGVLVAIGEKFRQGSGRTRLLQLLLKPKKLLRVIRGKIRSKRAGRPMLPKDLWSLKVIASMGTDSAIYKEKIKDLWGRAPLDVYGNTETT